MLNGLVISQLDMVYVEALLDELDAISLTVRSCRTVDRSCPMLSSPQPDELADTPSTQPMWMQPSGNQHLFYSSMFLAGCSRKSWHRIRSHVSNFYTLAGIGVARGCRCTPRATKKFSRYFCWNEAKMGLNLLRCTPRRRDKKVVGGNIMTYMTMSCHVR